MESHLRLSTRKLYDWMVVWGLFYCTFLSSLTQFILPRATLQMMINIVTIVLFGISYVNNKRKTMPMFFSILLVGMISFIIIGNIKVGDYEYWAQVRYVVILVFCLIGMKRIGWTDSFVNIILVMGIIYAVTTILLAFDTGIYQNIIVNWYPNTKGVLLNLYSENKFAGITDHYSTNGMVLANAMIIAASFAIISVRNKDKNRKKYIICCIIIIVALFLTAKRSHLLFGILAMYIGYYICFSKDKNHSSKMIAAIFITSLILIFAYIAIPQVRIVLERFLDVSDDTNIESRMTFWNAALNEFDSNTLFGIGWFGFRNNVAGSVNYSGHVHNVYIQLLCENGVVGAAIFFLWFVGCLVCTILVARKYFLYIKDTKIQMQLLFSLSYQIYFLMYCYTGNPMFDGYQYPVYFVACIIALYYATNKPYLLGKGEV